MVQLISNFMLVSTEWQVSACFSRALYSVKLACLITQLACLITQLACLISQLACSITQLAFSSLYLIVTGLLACTRALTRVACIANTLWVVIARYVFTRLCLMHYLSSSNSPVNVRIRKHIRKDRGLILLVTRPAKINHMSANYNEFYLC